MDFWCKPSSERVFKHTRKQKKDCARLYLHTGKNMYVSGQLLLRDVEAAFDVTDVTVCGVPEGVNAEICVLEYAVFNDGLPYPDIQKPGKSVHVPVNTTQGIWLHLWVSEAAATGKTRLERALSEEKRAFDCYQDTRSRFYLGQAAKCKR